MADVTRLLEAADRGDKQAARRFTGKDCGLCTDPQWTFDKKRIP